MKKQINDLLLKMQNGENCIGETANQLLDLFAVSGQAFIFTEHLKFNIWLNMYIQIGGTQQLQEVNNTSYKQLHTKYLTTIKYKIT